MEVYLAKHPKDIFSETTVNAAFINLLSDKYQDFFENLSVATDLEKRGKYLFGYGCRPHSCGIEESAFAIDIETGKTYAAILSEGSTLGYFGVETFDQLPQPLFEWIENNNRNIETKKNMPIEYVGDTP